MSSASLPDPVRPVSPTGRLTAAIGNGITRVTDRALGPYQSAIVRIGFSATWLLFLLREFPHRRELYGPEGPWSWELAQQLIATNDAFTVLMWSDSMVWFEIVYAVAVLAAFLLLLGWRTRAVSVLFMVGVLSLQNRSVFMGDGGDNVLHLMAIYLVFVRCAQVWSLDARRARRGRERLERDGRAPEDRVGPALWCVLGFALLVATFGGLIPMRRSGTRWLADVLLGAVGGARPVVGHAAASRRTPSRAHCSTSSAISRTTPPWS